MTRREKGKGAIYISLVVYLGTLARNQSGASIQPTWPIWTNQEPVFLIYAKMNGGGEKSARVSGVQNVYLLFPSHEILF